MPSTLSVMYPELQKSKESARVTQMKHLQSEALALFKRKNQDYGDSFANFGAVGVMVRMTDKLARFASVSSRGVSLVDDENLRDTLVDLANYSLMAIMCMDDEKREVDNNMLTNLIAGARE